MLKETAGASLSEQMFSSRLALHRSPLEFEIVGMEQLWSLAKEGFLDEPKVVGEVPEVISGGLGIPNAAPVLRVSPDGRMKFLLGLKAEFMMPGTDMLSQQETLRQMKSISENQSGDRRGRELESLLEKITSPGSGIAPLFAKVLQEQVSPRLSVETGLDGLVVYRRVSDEIGAKKERLALFPFFDGPDAKQNAYVYSPSETRVTTREALQEELETAMKVLSVYVGFHARSMLLPLTSEKIVIEPPAERQLMEEFMMRKMAGGQMPGAPLATEAENSDLMKSIVVTNAPDVTFDQIKGQENAVTEMQNIVSLISDPEACKEWGATMPRGVLFYGPPGTGKTMLAKAAANAAQHAFMAIRSSDILSKWYGESNKLVRQIFEIADKVASEHPSGHVFLFLDEVDGFIPSREMDIHEASRKVQAEILDAIDGLRSKSNITIIAATNRPEDLDDAFRSRMSYQIEVPLPDEVGLTEILKVHVGAKERAAERTLTADIDYGKIGREMKARNFSGREVFDLVEDVIRRKALQRSKDGAGSVPPISTKDLRESIVRVAKDLKKKAEGKIGFRLNEEGVKR